MKTLLDGGSFFESPRWHDDRWWVSDFYQHTVLSFDADGNDVRTEASLGDQPSGIGWTPEEDLLVVSMLDRRVLRRDAEGALVEHADLRPFAAGPCNDMVVDDAGRAWVGHFGYDFFNRERFRPSSIICVQTDGSVAVAAEELRFPNGSVVTPDGSTLIVGETFGARYTAFTIAGGKLVDRRIWAEVPGLFPDGCCLDERGCIWCADAGGSGAVLVEEGGEVVERVEPPDGHRVFACMLGGPDGTTLMLCCAPDSERANRHNTLEAIVVSVSVETARAGRP